MIKKVLATAIAMVMIMSFAACGDTQSSSSASRSAANVSESAASTDAQPEESTPEPTAEPVAEPTDDGIVNMDTDSFNVVYTRHEVGADYNGDPCLYYYYTFTNKAAENQMAAVATSVKAFQNGVECSTAISMEDRPEIENYMKEVQSGGSIEVCQVYELADMSEVTIEAQELMSLDDVKDTQVIPLQ